MPLVDKKSVSKVYLPTTNKLEEDLREWVVVDTSPLKGGDLATVDNYDHVMGINIDILAGRVQEWNVKDTNGEVAELTKENIGRLPLEDLAYLVTEINKGVGENAELPKVSTDNSLST